MTNWLRDRQHPEKTLSAGSGGYLNSKSYAGGQPYADDFSDHEASSS
jgi:hypothetical protein